MIHKSRSVFSVQIYGQWNPVRKSVLPRFLSDTVIFETSSEIANVTEAKMRIVSFLMIRFPFYLFCCCKITQMMSDIEFEILLPFPEQQ